MILGGRFMPRVRTARLCDLVTESPSQVWARLAPPATGPAVCLAPAHYEQLAAWAAHGQVPIAEVLSAVLQRALRDADLPWLPGLLPLPHHDGHGRRRRKE